MATSGKRRAAAAVEQVDGQDMPRLGFIAADPVDKRLTVDGAIFMSDGSKLDIDAYADLMTAFANEPLPESHADSGHPGVRLGEHIPKGLRVWDDVYAGASGKDGAGWIAALTSKRTGKKEKWFNIRSVGSWRMAFLLARLQREIWERFGDKAPLNASGTALLNDGSADLTAQATQSAVDPSLSQVSPGRTPKRKRCDGTSSPAKSVKRDTLAAGPALAPVAKDQTATENLQPGKLAPSPSPSVQMPASGTKMSSMLERIRAREAASKVASAQDQSGSDGPRSQ